MSVKPIKAEDVRSARGLDEDALKTVDALTETINSELAKPDNWNNLFEINTRERPNPNKGVRFSIPELEKTVDTRLTQEIIDALIDRYEAPEFG